MASAWRRGGTRSNQASARTDGAMAIDAVNFHGGARLAIKFSITVIVLTEVAIDALHSFFQVNVRQMNRFAESFWIVEVDFLVLCVKPVAFAVVGVDAAIDPAVSVKIGELSGLQLFVEFRAAGLLQKFFVTPESPRRSGLRIFQSCAVALFVGRSFLLYGVHFLAVDFVVPPRQ